MPENPLFMASAKHQTLQTHSVQHGADKNSFSTGRKSLSGVRRLSITLLLTILCGFGNSVFAAPSTNWYLLSSSNGDITVMSNWTQDYTGATASGTLTTFVPSTGITYFHIKNVASATMGASLTIGGGGGTTIIYVGDSTHAMNFTIPAAYTLTNPSAALNVSPTDTLTLLNAAPPALGTMATGSTVAYSAVGNQNIQITPYSNLTYAGSGTRTSLTSVTVNGTCAITGNITTSAAGAYYLSGNLTVSSGATWNCGNMGLNMLASAGIFNYGTITGGCSVYIIGAGNYTCNAITDSLFGIYLNPTSGLATMTLTDNVTLDALTALGGICKIYLGTGLKHRIQAMSVGSTADTIFAGNDTLMCTNNGPACLTGTFVPQTSTVEFISSNFGNINTNSFYNLIIATTTKENAFRISTSYPAAITVSNKLTINAGDTLSMGNIPLADGGSFNVTNNGVIQTTVATTLNPTPIPAGKTWAGVVQYNNYSSGAQTISAGTYSVLTTAAAISLGGNVSASSLSINGKVTTGANTLSMLNSGSISGTGSSNYIYGNLSKAISGASSVTYEIGDASEYLPGQLTLSPNGTGGSLGMSVTAGSEIHEGSSYISGTQNVNAYWTITNNSAAGPASVKPTENYNSGDITGGSNASFAMEEYTSGTWSPSTIPCSNSSGGSYSSAASSGVSLSSVAGDYIFGISTAPCSGTPAAGTALVSPGDGNASSAFTLSLSGASTATGITYQWQSSTGSGYSNITGATNATYNFTGITGNTIYQCVLTCPTFSPANSGSVTAVYFSPAASCTPSAAQGATACGFAAGITGFSLTGATGSINDVAPCNNTGYLDNITESCSLNAATTYTATVTTGTNITGSVQVWIDFNGDGTFQTSESVGGSGTSFDGSMGIALTIPAGVTGGPYRMRVVIDPSAEGYTYPNIDPCTSGYQYSEARDYSVTFGATGPTWNTVAGTHICVGTNPALTDATSGGTWSSTNTAVGTIGTDGTLTGISAGTTTISYAYSGGGGDIQVVTVNASPTGVSATLSASNIYAGSSVTITGTATNATNYLWAGPGGAAMTSTTTLSTAITSVTTGNAGIYTLTASNSCGTVTATTSALSVYATPTLSGSTACLFSTLTVTSSAPLKEIIWQRGGVGTSTVLPTYPTGIQVAGTSTVSGTDAAHLKFPNSVFVSGGNIYVADEANDRIMEWVPGASTGVEVAGTGTAGTDASHLNFPTDVSVDAGGNIYVVDHGNNRVQKFAAGSTVGTTVGSGLTGPMGLFVDGSGNIYVGNNSNSVQEFAPGVTTGTVVATGLSSPGGIYVDGTGNIYVTEGGANRVQKFAPGSTTGTVIASSGLSSPAGISVDAYGNIYVAENSVGRIARIAAGSSIGTAIIGSTAGHGSNQLDEPAGLYVDSAGDVYVADFGNSRIMEFSPTMTNTVIAGVAGNYTALVTSAAGSVTTNAVTVNPSPSAGTITGVATVVAGSNISLTDAATGGVWSSVSIGVGTVSASGVVTGISGGTTTISYTVSTGCGTVAATAIVTVTVASSWVTVAGSTLCAGSNTILTDATSGGAWSSDNTDVATVIGSTGVVTGAGAGTVTISYAYSGGGDTRIVTVNAIPTVGSSGGNVSICSGGNVTLSGTGAISYSWSGGVSDGVSFAPGSGISSYTVTGTTGSCSNTATTTVTVNVLPTVGSTGGGIAICSGSTVMLNGTGASTYSWSGGVTDGVSFVPGAGVTTYTVTGTKSGCSNTATTTVTVNTTDAGTITGPSVVVVGGSNIALTDAVAGGAWYVSNGNASIDGSGNVTGVTPGTVTVIYSVTGTCGLAGTTKLITVNSSSISGISGPATICQGAPALFTDITSGGTWSCSGPITVVGTTGVVTGTAPGVATVRYTAGGVSTTTTVTVLANPATITGAGSVCMGATASLSDVVAGGNWTASNPGLTLTPSGTTVSFVGAATGVTTVTYTLANTCSKTFNVTVNRNPTGIQAGSGQVCSGGTLNLSDTATTATGYTSSAATVASVLNSGVVTGHVVGIATITYTINNGCTTTTQITVNAAPAAISGVTPVCAGSTLTLTDGTGGGAWSSSNAGAGTIDPESGTITGIAGGTTVITYISGGCQVTATETVKPILPIIGLNAVSVGSAISLGDGSVGGTWSSGTPATASVSASGSVTGLDAGVANIIYTYSGCTRTQVITVNPPLGSINGSAALCEGFSTTLTPPTGLSGGTWSSSNIAMASVGSATGIVTAGPYVGTVMITYTQGVGSYTTMPVTLNAQPATISGPSLARACVNASFTLSDATSGGAWSTSNPSIGSLSGSGSVVTVTGVTPGSVTITYTLPTTCSRTFATINVNPLPAAINVGTGQVCQGTTLALNDPTSGATGWSSSSTSIATVTGGGLVTGVAAGDAYITYTVNTGCYIATLLTVNPAPAITPIQGPTSISHTASATISDATPGGVWSSSNIHVFTFTGTGSLVTVNALASTATATIYYTVTGAFGCTSVAARGESCSAREAHDGHTTVYTGTTVNIADELAGTWSSSDNSIAIVDAYGIVTGINIGTAEITHETTDDAGEKKTQTTSVVVSASPAMISIVPNPNKGIFTIAGTLGSVISQEVTLEIMDALGHVIYINRVMTNGGKINEQVALANALSDGIYYLNLRWGNNNKAFHFVVD